MKANIKLGVGIATTLYLTALVQIQGGSVPVNHEVLVVTGDTPALPFGGALTAPTGTGFNGISGTPGELLITDGVTGSSSGILSDDWIGLIPAAAFGANPVEHILQESEPEPSGFFGPPALGPGTISAGGPSPFVDAATENGFVTVSSLIAGAGFTAGGVAIDSGIYSTGFPVLSPLINPSDPVGMIAGTSAPPSGPPGILDDFPDLAMSPAADVAFTAGIFPFGLPGGGIGDEILCVEGVFSPAIRVLTTSSAIFPSPSPHPVAGPGGVGFFFQGPLSDLDCNSSGEVSFVNFLVGAAGAASAPPAGEGVHVYDPGIGAISPSALIIGATGTAVPTGVAAYPAPQAFADLSPPVAAPGSPAQLSEVSTVTVPVLYGPGVGAPPMPAGIDTGFVTMGYNGANPLGAPFLDDSVREGVWTFGPFDFLGDVGGVFFTVGPDGHYAFVNVRTGAAVTPTTDAAIVLGSPTGGAALVVLEGDSAPDGAGGMNGTYATFAGPFVSSPGFASGTPVVAFHATMVAGSTTGGLTDDEGIFVSIDPLGLGSPVSGVCQVIREGDSIILPGGGVDTVVTPLDMTPEIVWLNGMMTVVHDVSLASGATAVVRSVLSFREPAPLTIARTGPSSVEVNTSPTMVGYDYLIFRDTTLPLTTPPFNFTTMKNGDGTPLSLIESPLTSRAFFQGSMFPQF